MLTIQVVSLYPDNDTIIFKAYKNIIPIDQITNVYGINDVYESIQNLIYNCFYNSFLKFLRQNAVLAIYNNMIVGYCGIKFKNGLYVDSLCVDYVYRKQGIGKQILEKVQEVGTMLVRNISNLRDYVEYDFALCESIKNSPDYYIVLVLDKDEKYYGLLKFYKKCGFELQEMKGYGFSYFTKKLLI